MRQGDPIFPYSFVIAMEALNRLLLKAQDGGFILGFKIGGKGGGGEESLISFLLMPPLFFVRPLKSKSLSYVGCSCGSQPCRG